MSADDWRAAWERERILRHDAEARLSGMRWAMGAVCIAIVAVCAVVGGLRVANEGSRAVARWEVSQ